MAAAAGKKSMTSLSLSMEAFGLEVEKISLLWPRSIGQNESGCSIGAIGSLDGSVREVQTWRQVRVPAEAVM